MATRKKTAEELPEQQETEMMWTPETVDPTKDVELIEEPIGEPKVTMTMSELREMIAEEVRKAKGSPEPAKPMIEVRRAVRPRVKIKLFKDNGRYSKPVFVAVNGHKFIVPRGVEVEVPDYIAKVLDQSFAQDQETANQLMELERKFSEDTKKLK